MPSAHLLQIVYGRSRGTGVEEDDAVTTHHFVSTGASWPDTPPDNYEGIEAATNTMLSAWSGHAFSTLCKPREFRWYREDDLVAPPWGPAARIALASGTIASGANPLLPPQCALSVTEFTGLEETQEGRIVRHWGRFYIPCLRTTAIDTDGSLSTACQDAVADSVAAWYVACDGMGLSPAVRVTQLAGLGSTPAWVAPIEVRVDDLVDTQRRRRWELVTLRETRTFDPPLASLAP